MDEISFDISDLEYDAETKQKINDLLTTIDEQPHNEVPILKLASVYAQIWAGSHDPEVMLRVIFCLERVIALTKGNYENQIRKLIGGLRKRAEHSDMHQICERLDAVSRELDERLQKVYSEQAEQQDDVLLDSSLPKMDSEPTIETADGSEVAVPEPVGGFPEEWDNLSDVDEIPPAPSSKQAAQAQENIAMLKRLLDLVEAGQITEAIKAYTNLQNAAVKRSFADKMVDEIPNMGIEPVLALAATEDDKQVFRYIIRKILKSDRQSILDEIELESYSTDLQHVAIVVLSRLAIRGAVPKLQAALFINDILVRSVALHGLATTGKPSEETLHLIAETAEKDPHPKVRLAAAKALQTADSAESFAAFYRYSLHTTYDPKIQDVLEAMSKKFDPEEEARKEILAAFRENREMNKEQVKRIAKTNTEKTRVSLEDEDKPFYKKLSLSADGLAVLKAELQARKKLLVIGIVAVVVIVGGGILLWPIIQDSLSNVIKLLQASFPGLRPLPD